MAEKLTHDDYSVAWITALPLEMAAAKAMLDSTHSSLSQPSTDHNTYTLGRLRGHNIAIACLPSGVYGVTSAATVLSHMLPTFRNIRFGLMVGIGGGAPRGDVDIRLGDVVVSTPTADSGGVVQYDYGKTLRDGRFQRTGSLNKPPQFLLTAVSQMRSDCMVGEKPINRVLDDALRRNPGMKEQFSRPDQDWLFESAYPHEDGNDCSKCDGNRLISRAPRENEDPHAHYGLIASGNQVIKDAERRDVLVKEMDILCFEMEAAGLMDQLPSLVIRGICDYCDSHKNEQWQGYAALAAAAYAKSVLDVVPTYAKVGPKPTQLERHFMVPFQRNPRFVGREDEIAKIEELVNVSSSKIAVCGLGGVGKTQIALELAHRLRERFDCTFWIPCMSYESVEQAYLSIAQLLRIPGTQATEAKRQVKAYLSGKDAGKWLLIFDNADSMEMWSRKSESKPLRDYLPQNEHGRVLFTTRNRKVAVLLASSHVVHIAEPDPKAAVQIFEKSLIDKALLGENEATAYQLLEQLAFLPLAISQAAAYINENNINFSGYIALLQEQEVDVIELLSEDFGDDGRYEDIQNPVATTWLISFQQIQQLDRLAADYLFFMACINPREIPKSLLPDASSKKKAVDAIGLLKAFSFISEQAGALSLHRLVHISTRNWLRAQGNFDEQLSIAAERFGEVFPDDEHTNRKLWREYLPHVLLLIDASNFQQENYLQLIQRVGRCLEADGRYDEAFSLFENILCTIKELYGETDVNFTLPAMSDLAMIHRFREQYTDAEELSLQALDICTAHYGPNHPKTMIYTRNLAIIYSENQEPKKAEELQVRLLDFYRQMNGPVDRDTMSSMHNLAMTYTRLGKYSEAEKLQVEVLKSQKLSQWLSFPETMRAMAVLSWIYKKLDKWAEARELMEQTLELQKRSLGQKHPETIFSMENLTSAYWKFEQWSEARELLKQTLELQKQSLGQKHPDTILSMKNLTFAYCKFEQWSEARELLEQRLDLQMQILGPDHTEVLKIMGRLGVANQQLGRWEEAEAIQTQLLETSRRVLGLEDWITMDAMDGLARTWYHLEKSEQALNLWEECIGLCNETLGPDDPLTMCAVEMYNEAKGGKH